MFGRVSFVALLAIAGSASSAAGQDGWTGRVRAGFTAGAQVDTTRLAQSSTLVEYLEPAPLTAESPAGAVPWFDGGFAVRLFHNVGVGLSFSYLSGTSTAQVEADIPHPFYFNQPRRVSGEVGGVRHKELATHVAAVYVFATERIDLALSGGATFFNVEQSFVEDLIYVETYPYDTAEFVDAPLTEVTESKTGYHVGADVTWKFSPSWGIGGLIRFSRARIPFQLNGLDVGTQDVGGLQAGAGLRVMF